MDRYYPRARHHETKPSVLVTNALEEAEKTPDAEGWSDLRPLSHTAVFVPAASAVPIIPPGQPCTRCAGFEQQLKALAQELAMRDKMIADQQSRFDSAWQRQAEELDEATAAVAELQAKNDVLMEQATTPAPVTVPEEPAAPPRAPIARGRS